MSEADSPESSISTILVATDFSAGARALSPAPRTWRLASAA